jgi:hypothetical protein
VCSRPASHFRTVLLTRPGGRPRAASLDHNQRAHAAGGPGRGSDLALAFKSSVRCHILVDSQAQRTEAARCIEGPLAASLPVSHGEHVHRGQRTLRRPPGRPAPGESARGNEFGEPSDTAETPRPANGPACCGLSAGFSSKPERAPRLRLPRALMNLKTLGRSRWLNGLCRCLHSGCADGTEPRPSIEP